MQDRIKPKVIADRRGYQYSEKNAKVVVPEEEKTVVITRGRETVADDIKVKTAKKTKRGRKPRIAKAPVLKIQETKEPVVVLQEQRSPPLWARMFRSKKLLTQEQVKPEKIIQSKIKEVPTPPVDANEPKVKEVGGRCWWLAGVGTGILAIAIPLIGYYGQSRNIGLGLLGVLGLMGGGFAVYSGLKSRDTGIIITPDGKVNKKKTNCLNLYPDRIEFAELPRGELLGQPLKCLNDGKYYHIHIWDESIAKFKLFILPDTQYRDPKEFANNLNIPAHRKLAQRRASLMQKIAPFAIVAAMGIMVFLFLVTE